VLAAFEMDEILYELRDHAAGLNVGRWDYLFSFIKKLRNDRSKVMPDRAKVTMTTHFMRAYDSCWSRPRIGARYMRWAAWRRRRRSGTARPPTRTPGQGAPGEGPRVQRGP